MSWKDMARCVASARDLRLDGSATFVFAAEAASFVDILAHEEQDARLKEQTSWPTKNMAFVDMATHFRRFAFPDMAQPVSFLESYRFLVTWCFDADTIADLLGHAGVCRLEASDQVESDRIAFSCGYGLSFSLSLIACKPCADINKLSFKFGKVVLNGCSMRSVNVRAGGAIVSPHG